MSRFHHLIVFLRPFKRSLILALVATGVLTLIGMAPPLLMRRLLNDVAREGNWGIFPLIATLLVAVPILRALVNIVNAIALNNVAQGIVVKTRKRLFRHLMTLSLPFFDKTPVGSLNQRLMGDVGTISGVAGGGLIALIADAVAVVFAISVMLKLSLWLTLLTLALLPLYYLNYWFFSKRIKDTTAVLRTRMDHISSSLQERLSAHELMQAYGQEKASSAHFQSHAKQIMDAAVKGSAYSISFNQLSAFINKLGNTAIYCLGCYYFIQGTLEYGDVVAFCAYATQLLGPVVRVSQVANQLVQVNVSVDRINQILAEEPDVKESDEPQPITDLEGDIQIDSLAFGYGGEPVLRDLALHIPAGTHLAVVGTPGSGRSTMASLLRRFYDPDEGEVKVDGVNIRDYKLRDYRQAMAMVLPESAIFDGTIRENLCYGNPEAAEERMLQVAQAVGLHDFVSELPDGYETRLGSGGLRLSAGYQQRLGIGRALLSDPLVLIIDEATTALDAVSADEINHAIRQAMEGRTCLIFVHRLLLAKDLDRVIVMQEGQVAESGKHDELVEQEMSLYRTIYAGQYGEDKLPPVTGGPPT